MEITNYPHIHTAKKSLSTMHVETIYIAGFFNVEPRIFNICPGDLLGKLYGMLDHYHCVKNFRQSLNNYVIVKEMINVLKPVNCDSNILTMNELRSPSSDLEWQDLQDVHRCLLALEGMRQTISENILLY